MILHTNEFEQVLRPYCGCAGDKVEYCEMLCPQLN